MHSFYSWAIFHCVYTPKLSYPCICQWTARLLPCPSYCKQCCNEYWSTLVSFNSGFLSMYALQWDFWVIWQFYFQFKGISTLFSIVAVLVCIPTKSVREFPFLHFISSIWPMVLEKTLESSLDSKEIQQVNPKGNQSWIYFGRTDAEAETPIGHLWWRTDSFEETLMLGKIEDGRRRWQKRMGWLDGITD